MRRSARIFAIAAVGAAMTLGLGATAQAAVGATHAAATAVSASPKGGAHPADWDPVPLNYYNDYSDCEEAGLNGEHNRWWQDYRCVPQVDYGYMLYVDYY